MLFCHVTSQVEGEPYPDLVQQKGGLGHPYMCFMDASGNVIAKPRFTRVRDDGAAALEESLAKDVGAYLKLEQAAKTGGKKERATFFMRQFDLGHFGLQELQAVVHKGAFLEKRQIARVRERIMELQVKRAMENIDMSKPETFGPYAMSLLRIHKVRGLPEGPAGAKPWFVILEDAHRRGDADTFAMALRALRAAGVASPTFVAARQKQLEALRKAKKEKEK